MDGKREMRAAQWREHVSAWRSSGQTQAAHCAARDLSLSTLGYWISRLRLSMITPADVFSSASPAGAGRSSDSNPRKPDLS